MKKKKIGITITAFLLLSCIIFFNPSFPLFSFVSGVFQSLYQTPKVVVYQVYASTDAESSEVQKLKKENEELKKKLIQFNEIKRENDALRSQFNTENRAQDNLIPVRVVGSRGSLNVPTVLIIDHGRKSGIKTGATVVLENNLVGVIGAVGEQYAEVKLVNNPGFTTIGLTNEKNSRGIVKGANDFMVLDRVVITDSLKNGDLVITRGNVQTDGTGIKPDLIIGKITDVNKNESDPFQTARIDSQLPLGKLTHVFVYSE
jgi:rod shape-determining protein MreC